MDTNYLYIVTMIAGFIIPIGSIVGIVVYVRSKAQAAKASGIDDISAKAFSELQITVSALTTQNSIQAGQIQESKSISSVQDKKIAELTGKVDTLSTIPLDKIEKHMSDTNKILQAILPLVSRPSTEHTFTETTTTKK